MSDPKHKERVDHIYHTIMGAREQVEKIDSRIRIVRIGNQFLMENAERYQYYPQISALNRELEQLNHFIESHSDEDLIESLYELHEDF